MEAEGFAFEDWVDAFLDGDPSVWDLPETPLYMVCGDLSPNEIHGGAREAYLRLEKKEGSCSPEAEETIRSLVLAWWVQETRPEVMVTFLFDQWVRSEQSTARKSVHATAICARSVLNVSLHYKKELEKCIQQLESFADGSSGFDYEGLIDITRDLIWHAGYVFKDSMLPSHHAAFHAIKSVDILDAKSCAYAAIRAMGYAKMVEFPEDPLAFQNGCEEHRERLANLLREEVQAISLQSIQPRKNVE